MSIASMFDIHDNRSMCWWAMLSARGDARYPRKYIIIICSPPTVRFPSHPLSLSTDSFSCEVNPTMINTWAAFIKCNLLRIIIMMIIIGNNNQTQKKMIDSFCSGIWWNNGIAMVYTTTAVRRDARSLFCTVESKKQHPSPVADLCNDNQIDFYFLFIIVMASEQIREWEWVRRILFCFRWRIWIWGWKKSTLATYTYWL